MANEKTCPRCGRPLGAQAPQGLCPECLIEAGFATGAAPEGSAPTERATFTPPPVADLAKLFPQLEIMELLGQGGMGAVYKARQKHLERLVALKILPPGIGADPAFAERFTREAKALARLNHPGVVTLYESGQVDGLYYFLMEFVDGVSLRHLLEGKRLKPREALAIVPQICEALQYAHDQGIVHRDIKPENILLDRQGRVKVADFGLAKLVKTESFIHEGRAGVASSTGSEVLSASGESTAARGALTQPDKVMGTPQYMAPEQWEHPTEVDHRADIYSLGVVFYEMLTGELPVGQFKAPSRKAVLDVRLDEVVLGALAKEPEDRYQHAREMKTDVETIATAPATSEASTSYEETERKATALVAEAGEPVSSPSGDLNAASSPDAGRPLRRRRRTADMVGLITAGVVLGCLCLVGIVWLWRERPKSPPVVGEPAEPVQPVPGPAETIQTVAAGLIPPRDPQATRNLIDLTGHYNGDLNHNWHNSWDKGNDLRELPFGLQTMAGTLFDVRGVIAVTLEFPQVKLPPAITGIPIGQKCKQLHFLHSAYNSAYSNGEQIGRYIVHYANDEQEIIPIVSGQDVLDWHKEIPPGSPLVIAWEGENVKTRRASDAGKRIHLFKSTWENPRPDLEIKTIDIEAVRRGPAPFLVALTVE